MADFRCVVAVLLLCATSSSHWCRAQELTEPAGFKALVIGNSAYRNVGPCATAANDAHLLAAALRKASFTVKELTDLDLTQLENAITEFRASLQRGDLAMFYFAGYAVQAQGDNYILPIDFPADKGSADTQAYSLMRIDSDLAKQGTGSHLLILDASRENSVLSARFPEPGLTIASNFGPGSLIAFSASAGRTAPTLERRPTDLFTETIARLMSTPDLTTGEFFERVRSSVSRASSGTQVPVVVSSLVRQQFLPRLTLLPEPWPEHEYAEYRTNLNGRLSADKAVYAIESSPNNPNNIVLRARDSEALAWYRVEVDRRSMAPVSSSSKRPVVFSPNFPHGVMGYRNVEYQDGQAHWTFDKQEGSIPVERWTFDRDEIPFLIRRMPLVYGYNTIITVLDQSGAVLKAGIAVRGIVDIEVPAGRFHCFKVEVAASQGGVQIFWYAADGPRTLAKSVIGGKQIELTRLSPDGPQPTTHHDPYIGFSFVTPPGWLVIPFPGPNTQKQMHVNLMDPEGQASYITIWSTKGGTEPAQMAAWLATRPPWRERERKGQGFRDFKNRPESTRLYPITGGLAQSTIADYVEDGRSMVEYFAWFSTKLNHLNICAGGIDLAGFDSFVKRFQPILDSLTLP